ncbi:hypothetical protein [Streptococcus pneumoniae]|uniref:hypothetical protein n=1 Tax=Streptococcus pneumoniae TaxID=1313 RepID=UPI0015DA789D|nr:hypothetical protein [Streptococcus pneumoniae]
MRFSYLKDFLLNLFMLNENQTRKLAAGCSKQCFEVADGTVLRLWIELTELTWFEEIFEEYYLIFLIL